MTSLVLGEEVRAVGPVPDEVLLRCGRDVAEPSPWWTPWLHARPAGEVAALRSATDELLRARGVLTADGRLVGPLGEVAAVVRDASCAVLVEREAAAGDVERSTLLATADRAVLATQLDDEGVQDVLLATPAGAVALLVGLLDPGDAGRAAAPPQVVSADELRRVLPEGRRRATTRVVAAERPTGSALVLTLVEDGSGLAVARPLADGGAVVERTTGDGVVALARGLLGAEDR